MAKREGSTVTRHNELIQLMGLAGTSTRSAEDPWTISRSYSANGVQGSSNGDATVSPGETTQQLQSDIAGQKSIWQADHLSPSNSTQTSGTSTSGILGWLSDAFPLASGIAKLFGFGQQSSPPALQPYERPPSISFSGAISETTGAYSSLSYGQNGLPRTTATVDAVTSGLSGQVGPDTSTYASLATLATPGFAPAPGPNSSVFGPSASNSSQQQGTSPGSPGTQPASQSGPANGLQSQTGSSSSTPQQITVQVQAMDSQSFLDRSQDIAQAVRHAMLNSHPVNDVISDL